MITFDSIINDNIEYHNNDYKLALIEFITKKYNSLSFIDSLTINPGDTLLFIRDVISDIKCINNNLFYVIDDKEYPITTNTRLLICLSPLKNIYLRNKSSHTQLIIFKRYFIKSTLIDTVISKIIKDRDHIYFRGKIY